MKKFKLFKLLALFVVLITSINTAWATMSFHDANTGVKFSISRDDGESWSDYEVKHGTSHSTEEVGIVTNLYLKEYFVQLYQNEDNLTGVTHVNYWFYSGDRPETSATSYNGNWGSGFGSGDWYEGKRYPKFGNNNISDDGGTTNVNLLYGKGAGEYTFEYYFDAGTNSGTIYSNNGGGNFKVEFTVPGFSTSSTDADVNSSNIGSSSSTTITFGQHYGTELATTSTKTITGTHASLFSVTSINETSVTVQFSPTAGSGAGVKTATLRITDAHGRTCDINLTGKTQYTVTYAAGTYGTGSSQTANKVFEENLTLADKGYFTRTGYHQTGWNTNTAGTGGNSYSLNGTYEDDAAITLYPTWTANDYTIAFDPNDANYVGTATGTTASINATYDVSYTLTSNGFERAGYTFAGWTTNADGTGNEYTDAQTGVSNLTSTNEGTVTLYAKWTENKSTITINTPAAHEGSLSVTGNYSLGVTTTKSVTASSVETGFMFDSWTKTGNAVLSSTTDNPTTVSADGTYNGTGTVTAVFVPRFAVVGSKDDGDDTYLDNGMPGWGDFTKTLDYYGANDSHRTLSLKGGSTTYKFRIKDKKQAVSTLLGNTAKAITLNGESGLWMNTSENGNDVKFTLDFSDDITFKAISFGGEHLELKLLTSDGKTDYYTATFAYKTFYGDETSTTSEGGTVTAKDWKNYALTSGQKAKAGKAVTMTATPSDGYAFAGWYSDAACTSEYELGEGESIVDNVINIIGAKDAAKAVYAKFTEKMTTINLEAENGSIHQYVSSTWSDAGSSIQAGVHTKPQIKAIPATGYYFTGWVRTAGSDYDLGAQAFETEADSIVNNLTGRGEGATSGQTLTAKFEQLEKIYFRNDINGTHWANVYVYFDVTWDGSTNCVQTSANNSTKKLHVAMTRIGETYIYWAYVPRYFTTLEGAGSTKVAYANFDESSNSTILKHENDGDYNGAMRSDYNKALNMFVPNKTKTATGWYTKYYSNGYWKNYSQALGDTAGYTLKRWRQATNDYRTVGEFLATGDPNIIKYRFRVDSLSSQAGRSYYDKYIVYSAGNIKYKASSTITISGRTNVTVVDDNSTDNTSFTLTPNRLGYYVITLDQSGDQMKMSVNYPLDVNDYILEHTYIVPKVTDGTDSTVYSHSDVIKFDSAANVTRYSMFLSNGKAGSTSTLKLRQCTNPATQAWSAGDATNLSSILTQLASDGNGVYQFDLSVDKTNNCVAAVVTDSTRLYTGKYYIKTDSITGGWINYKRNALEHNTLTFKASNPNSFDYYYCKFFYPIGGSGVNPGKIKCVIANDYCNAVSDTLFGDGIATGPDPTVPSYTTYEGTSIRFSYNSTTNQLKRSYLGASTNDYYLDINVSTDNMVTATVTIDKVEYTEDLYPSDFASTDRWAKFCRFDDTEDWVYEKVVKVKPGAKGGIVAKFGDTTQDLLASDHLLLGCKDGSCTGEYDILLVYDFKTNYLMASWIPGGAVSDKLKDVDMLWERVADNSAQQISFSGTGSLEKVKVVGAIRFDYDSVYYSPSGEPHWTDLETWTPASRRWLKYFVSFPFDVPVSSVFGLAGAELGRDYIIQKYNGDKRAKEGLYFGDGGNFWENLTKDSIMHANEGYCVIFDNDYARGWYGSWWNHKKSGSHVYLYFPAKDTIASITGGDKEVTVAKHKCNIDRRWYDSSASTWKNHTQSDSHWNLIGTPKFQDAYIKAQSTDTTGLSLTAYYYLDYSDNKWKTKTLAEDRVFKAMHSYWVQWAGTITWTTTDPGSVPVASAPARNRAQAQKLSMKLNLMYNGKATDWTYVEMAENADEDFRLCEDLCKVYNQNSTHIYTYAGDYDVAYNKLPIAGRTVNVGVDIYRNGTYTFAMPDNFDGVVILVDNVTETRTNLAAGNYEVYLNKGTYNERFALEINISNAPTAIDAVEEGNDSKVHKFIQNGLMYILRNGIIYDARGNRVR